MSIPVAEWAASEIRRGRIGTPSCSRAWGQTIVRQGDERRVAEDHLFVAHGRGVPVEDGLHVGSEPAAQFGQLL